MAIKIQSTTVVDDGKNGRFLSLSVDPSMGSGPSYVKIPYYATAAARDASITSPTVGMICVRYEPKYGISVFEGYDGTRWTNIAGPVADEALTLAIMAL